MRHFNLLQFTYILLLRGGFVTFGPVFYALACSISCWIIKYDKLWKKQDYSTVILWMPLRNMLLVYYSTHQKQVGGRACKQACLPWIHSSAYLSHEVWLGIKATCFSLEHGTAAAQSGIICTWNTARAKTSPALWRHPDWKEAWHSVWFKNSFPHVFKAKSLFLVFICFFFHIRRKGQILLYRNETECWIQYWMTPILAHILQSDT